MRFKDAQAIVSSPRPAAPSRVCVPPTLPDSWADPPHAVPVASQLKRGGRYFATRMQLIAGFVSVVRIGPPALIIIVCWLLLPRPRPRQSGWLLRPLTVCAVGGAGVYAGDPRGAELGC